MLPLNGSGARARFYVEYELSLSNTHSNRVAARTVNVRGLSSSLARGRGALDLLCRASSPGALPFLRTSFPTASVPAFGNDLLDDDERVDELNPGRVDIGLPFTALNRPDFRSYRIACPAGAGWADSRSG